MGSGRGTGIRLFHFRIVCMSFRGTEPCKKELSDGARQKAPKDMSSSINDTATATATASAGHMV